MAGTPPGDEDAPLNEPARPCVLLADDESSVRRLGERALTQAGFEVIAAQDGVEAVECFQRHHARLSAVVLDMTMPRMSGTDALEAMHAINPSVPVILSTGYLCEDSSTASNGKGFSALIQKPYRLGVLIDTVNEVLSRSDRGPKTR